MSKTAHGDDVAFIRALAELLRENDLTELEVKREFGEDNALNVRVSRAAPPPLVPAPAPVAITAAPTPAEAAVAETSADPASDPGAVTSPMVGTVYLQPEPGAEPFIRTGSTVAQGQTLLIVEAMKTMNHIPAPRAGTISRILVEDGSPVEFGAPLVILS